MAESKAKSKAKESPRKSAAKSTSESELGATVGSRASEDESTKTQDGWSVSRRIDQRIRDLDGWRGETLARVRALVLEADPEITEEWMWENPVWSHHGIICTGEAYRKVVKLTFAQGAGVPDPSHLFNSSLVGNTRRAIDIHEGETVDAGAFKTLVKAAAARNASPSKKTAKSSTKSKPSVGDAKPSKERKEKKVALLSGGNPQIAKADGDAPVQAYIAAMPGWKRDIGRCLDALIARTVPNVRKAVKWNSPFYGIADQGWFATFHVYTRYVKLTFFQGKSLKPVPIGSTPKSNDARGLDIYEGDELDEAQLATWMKQAAVLPGWVP